MVSVVKFPPRNYTDYRADEWVERVLRSDGELDRAELEIQATLDRIESERLFPHGPSLGEIRNVYVPFAWVLARRIARYFEQRVQDEHACFILGVGGSVSVGKTTAARVLRALLTPLMGSVEVVATDHFLLPNDQLEKMGLMRRKGFPESYDQRAIDRFMQSLRRGDRTLSTPLYDHVAYTRLQGRQKTINRPKCLILEGVSALQRPEWALDARVFFQADEADLWQWYWERFLEFRRRAKDRPDAYFHRYSQMTESEALVVAQDFWINVNWVNMKEYIEPSRLNADWIIDKGPDHIVRRIIEADGARGEGACMHGWL